MIGGSRPAGPGRRRGTRAAVLALSGALVLGLVGCSSAEEPPDPTTEPTPTFEPSYVEPPAPIVAPLTGITVEPGSPAAGALEGPSLAAKIDNHRSARPQFGLERADVVFEELVEGGLTRYVAVWHSDVPPQIGPVRSIRPMDPDIISPFGGIVAYSGGQERFVAMMRATNVVNAIHGEPGTEATFSRLRSRIAPHNVVVAAPELLAAHADLPAPKRQFPFAVDVGSASAVREGSPTAGIALDFGSGVSRPSWSWDPGRGEYVRAQAGQPDLDANGAQLGAENVVVIRVAVSDVGVPKTELIGSGEAWVSSGGSTVHGSWGKTSAEAPIRVVGDNGAVVRLAPGNTWVELVPHAGSVALAPAG